MSDDTKRSEALEMDSVWQFFGRRRYGLCSRSTRMILAAARRHGFSSRTAGEKEMVFRLTTIGERRELFRKMYLATAIRQLLLAIRGRRQKRAGRP